MSLSKNHLIHALSKNFIKEYDLLLKESDPALKHELTEHLLNTALIYAEYLGKEYEEELYTKLNSQENAFLKKYGKRLIPYHNLAFNKYFQWEIAIAEKTGLTTEEFNALSSEMQRLTFEEKMQFLGVVRNVLTRSINMLYLQSEGEAAKGNLSTSSETTEEKESSFTRSRQMLAIYYLLKAGFGIEHRKTNDVSQVVRMVHLLTGVKLTSLTHSDIYKKYREIPNHKKSKALIEDLQFIRPFFAELDLSEAVKLIDEEIRMAKNELK